VGGVPTSFRKILIVPMYIMHRGQCINKGEGNVIPLG
jgi:hypothetical protein